MPGTAGRWLRLSSGTGERIGDASAQRVFLVLLTAFLMAQPVVSSGQVLSGRVVHPDSTSPVHGVLVVVETHSFGTLRTLTDSRGAFRVRLPQPDSARVRVLRIGFRPHDSPAFYVDDRVTEPLLIVLENAPYAMSMVTITSESRCGRRADDEGWRRWEQALTVLHRVNLTREDTSLTIRVVEYDGLTTEDNVTRIRGDSLKLVTNAPPLPAAHYDSLIERGFVRENPGDSAMYYYAPDAQLLADARFAPAYCFHSTEPAAGDSTLIGVAFSPVWRRRTTDIEGTLWLDKDSFELRRIDFEYVQLPRGHNIRGPGGYVAFRQLPTGHWIISEWLIRMAKEIRFFGRYSEDIDSVYVGHALPAHLRARIVTTKFGLWARGQMVVSVQQGTEQLYGDLQAELLARRAQIREKRPD